MACRHITRTSGALSVLGLSLLATSLMAPAVQASELKLFSMNMYGAGANKDKSIDETVAVLKASGAEIIAAQETVPEPTPCGPGTAHCMPGTASRAADVAKALGYNYHEFKHGTDNHWADVVFSKYPLGQETPNGAGVEVAVHGKKVIVYAMNLNDAPYVPYQLTNIAYGDYPFITTEAEAITFAKQAHGKALELLLQDIASEKSATAQFVMGDFNEPSHLDWTAAAVAARQQPVAVAWPFSKGLADAGLVDAYRAIYPDPVAKPAFTWTTTTEPGDPTDHHDRIDFIMVTGQEVKITSAAIVGEKSPQADVVMPNWPSDHRAVAVTVELP